MKRYAVIGHPIGHSLSPLMHNTAFHILGIDGKYEKLDIAPQDVEKAVKQFRDPSWGGFNITTPHKIAIIPFLDEINEEAQSIHSVNTVTNRHGFLIGTNTDVPGIWHSLEQYQTSLSNSPCVILGTGGVVASVMLVLT